MSFDAFVHGKAIDLIRQSIKMTTAAGSGHPTSAASLAHLVTVLMYHHMRYDPARPDDPSADRLVLSEGHACPIVYAAAADLGVAIVDGTGSRRPMTCDDALGLRRIESPIDGHPNPAEGFPFFPAATGSLGQGLSVAAGLALGARLDGLDRRIFCLIGDGESREGQIAEALDFIIDYHLSAVCPIFNCNAYGQADRVSHQQSPNVLTAKLRAWGYEVRRIDGHNPTEIRSALDDHAACSRDPNTPPLAIVAQTVKGWGFLRTAGEDAHGKPVPAADESAALAELEATATRVGAARTPGELPGSRVKEDARPQRRQSGESSGQTGDGATRQAAGHRPPMAARASEVPDLDAALREYGQEKLLAKGRLAPRKAFGVALRALGRTDPRIVALDGDVRNSTFSEFFYQDADLRERFYECKIAEQHMVSCAGGLAAAGKIPFVSTFGKFITRAYDQVEMGLISRFNLKLVGTHVGVSLAADGPSQMALADTAFFRAWATARERGEPVLYVLYPADARSAYCLTVAMAHHEGACYLRAMRPDVPLLYDQETSFKLGGHHVVRRGRDLLIVATGYMVHEALNALQALADEGIDATLVDLYCLPFDESAIAALAREHQGRVLTVEDNYGGSMGSAVADALAERNVGAVVRQLYVRRIPKSGRSPEDLLRYVGLSQDDLVRAARELTGGGAATRGTAGLRTY